MIFVKISLKISIFLLPKFKNFAQGHLAMTLANLFIVRWLNIQKPFVTAQGMVPMRLVMWTVGCQFAQYWAARTGGLVFVSTWFLVNAQAFAAFPALKLKYPKLNTLNRLAFALSFLIIRVVLWAWMINFIKFIILIMTVGQS